MILGHHGPAVGQNAHVALASVDHRFDREHHAGSNLETRIGLAVVQNLRVFVIHAADAMATVLAHHRKPFGLGPTLDGMADVPEMSAWAHQFDGAPHRILADLGQALRQHRRLADEVHAAGIPVITLFDHRDIDVEDVPALEAALVRNAVTDHMIHRGADGLRKAAIADIGRNRLLHIHDVIVTELVELIGADPRRYVVADHVQHVRRQGAGNTQFLLLFSRFQCDLCGAQHGISQRCLKHCSGWNFMV
jgi:hypothetical protein